MKKGETMDIYIFENDTDLGRNTDTQFLKKALLTFTVREKGVVKK